MATATRSVRLDPDVLAALDERAKNTRLSSNTIIVALVEHWLRLGDENLDAAILLITRPDMTLRQHLAALEGGGTQTTDQDQ
jgi:hypothetical protein